MDPPRAQRYRATLPLPPLPAARCRASSSPSGQVLEVLSPRRTVHACTPRVRARRGCGAPPRALRLANLKSLRRLCKLAPPALPFARLPRSSATPFPNPRSPTRASPARWRAGAAQPCSGDRSETWPPYVSSNRQTAPRRAAGRRRRRWRRRRRRAPGSPGSAGVERRTPRPSRRAAAPGR